MTGTALTQFVLLVVVAGLAVYDVVIIRTCGPPASLSCVIHGFCRQHPVAALALGVLIGHVFWPLLEQ